MPDSLSSDGVLWAWVTARKDDTPAAVQIGMAHATGWFWSVVQVGGLI